MVTYASKQKFGEKYWEAKTCRQCKLESGWSKDLYRNQTMGIGDELELPTHVRFQQTDQFSQCPWKSNS